MSRDEPHADAARFQFENVELGNGWSARVLIDWTLPEDVAGDSVVKPPRDDWRSLLTTLALRPDELPERVDLKHSRTARVFRARVPSQSPGLQIVCKNSGPRPWWRGSRERRTWNAAFGLLRAGIRTALPRALVERRGRLRSAWLVTEAIPDAIDLDGVMSWQVYALERERVARVKQALAVRVAALCSRMRSRGIYHRDFKASNVLVTDWDGSGALPRLWLVDLDGVQLRNRLSARAAWRAVTRLGASLVDCNSVTLTDCARFVRALSQGPGSTPHRWKSDWRRLEHDVAKYNRRSRDRKHGKLDGFLED